MYGQTSLMGLGISIDPNLSTNIQQAVEAQPSTAGGGFLEWLNKTVQTVAPIVTTVKSTVDQVKAGTATYNPNIPAVQAAPMTPAAKGMSQGTKIALGVGAAALVGGLVYVSRKKKR